ncbi:hypothetical protein Sjap_025800 [Stephania japonica]|uniref:Protein kinase domain-containing protein n=1 Tax=Stephania japonica TaxID=461633 RepID=A0AAP0EA73_9MAGN
MSPDVVNITYNIVVAFVSIVLLALVIVLIIICRKRPIESEDGLPHVKLCARNYLFIDIEAATDGFNPRRIIGKGRLGTVYTAVLSTGDMVAVKRINPLFVLSNAGFGFSSLIKSLSLAQHPNVVPIIGFSEAIGERIIVMEFMGMKSLDFYLHRSSMGAPLLDWPRRLKIASGVAQGLEHLHEGLAPPLIHGCVKPCNILMDESFNARVCDYGLSFLGAKERRGLVGYVDKEYWVEKGGFRACKACDVYGFGVVLLELLSGRRCGDGLIVEWALPLIRDMRVLEVLDPKLCVPIDMKPNLVRLAKVALVCVGNSRENRPSIAQVSAILKDLVLQA